MSELPTGTVTLLLADVEGSTRLWESHPEVMKAAVARLDAALSDAVTNRNGVRPVEQGEGDSFVIAFARAVDAVGCALALQHAPLAPIKLRIGIHTGDIQLRDEGNYIGPTINRTARLRDLAHGGQTVLSGATEPLVVDQLPPEVTLRDLGTHSLQGQIASARTAAEIAFQRLADMFDAYTGIVYAASAFVHLAAGDAAESCELWEAARERTRMDPQLAAMHLWAALAPLACGDIAAARRWADEVVSATSGWSYAAALLARARVEIVQGAFDAAERDAYEGLDLAGRLQGDLLVPVALDCLATTAARADSLLLATRLFGAADAAYRRMGMVRFKVLEADDQATLASLRESLGDSDFEAAWTEGAALSNGDAVAYALRGRGERKRASSGWGSLTRAELDVVKLIGEGLGNKDIAARLFISPRTVQAHLTHIYTKLGLTSRVQLAQEAARHS